MEFHIDRRYAFLCCTFFLLLRNPDRTNAQTFGLQSCEYQENGRTIYSACVPEPFNILFPGRSSYNLTITPADSTCGLTTNFQSYCLIYSPVGGDRCLTCDSTDDNNKHPREYMVDVDADGDGNMQTWWQSKSWYDYPTPLQVSIELAFDKQYELTDNLVITFESARPKSMNLELSRDFGQTWQIVQYYDMNCNSSLLGLDAITATNPTAVVCVSSDSQLTPYTNGLVTFGVLNDRYAMYLGANYGNYSALYNAFSNTNLNSFLTFTNIRINLLEPNNLGLGAGAQSTVQSTLQEASAYYAISNIKITASCSCNLHGKFCQMDPTKGRTVCVCQHNTMGDNCEMCKPLYNKRPWMPGLYLPTGRIPSGTANECQKCECNDHAESCVFNTALGRPICINCMHNTAGEKCDSCINAYFENTTLPLNSPDICIPCDCEPLGVMNNQLLCDQTLGTCTCKPGVVGRKCDECQPGFYGLLLADENPGECKQCGCNTAGTYDLVNKCDKTSGDCTCKPNIEGAKCDSCKDGFYQYPSNTVLIVADCLSCDCDTGGAVNNVCDKGNGQCNCRIGMTGRKCDQVIGGSFSPYIDYYSYQVSSGTCGLSTDLITDSNPFTGRTFMVCAQNQEVVFDTVSNLNTGSLQYAFKPVLRYLLNGSLPWQEMTLRATTMGNSEKDLSKYAQTPGQNIPAACPESAGGIKVFQIQNLTAGVGLAWTAENMTMDVRCKYQFNLLVGNPGLAGSEARLYVDSVVLSPDVKQTGIYGRADPSTQLEYEQCFFNFLQLSTRSSALVPPVCSSLMSSVGVEMEGQAPDCQCNQIGTMDSVNLQCNSLGGQCSCKPGVFGRSCDVCMPGYYEFSYLGCKLCPELPCPGDPAFDVTFEVEERSGSSRAGLIIAILVLLLIIIIVVVFLVKRRWREACFRKLDPHPNVKYADLEGKDHITPPPIKRNPMGQTEIPYRQENELNLALQLAPDIPRVIEHTPQYSEPEKPARPKPKSRDKKPKEKTSLKQSFGEVDRYNAMKDKGKAMDENLVEINAEELLDQQKQAMRRELKRLRENIKNKDGTSKKRPSSRQNTLSGTENVAFTNETADIDSSRNPEQETLDNVLNEMHSQKQNTLDLLAVPETAVISSGDKKQRHVSGSSDRSRRSGESRDGRSSRSNHGEKREHRRRKDGHLSESMRSSSSGRSGRSDRPKRRHSRRSQSEESTSSADPKAILMTDKSYNEFTNLEPIDEVGGSLV